MILLIVGAMLVGGGCKGWVNNLTAAVPSNQATARHIKVS